MADLRMLQLRLVLNILCGLYLQHTCVFLKTKVSFYYYYLLPSYWNLCWIRISSCWLYFFGGRVPEPRLIALIHIQQPLVLGNALSLGMRGVLLQSELSPSSHIGFTDAAVLLTCSPILILSQFRSHFYKDFS